MAELLTIVQLKRAIEDAMLVIREKQNFIMKCNELIKLKIPVDPADISAREAELNPIINPKP